MNWWWHPFLLSSMYFLMTVMHVDPWWPPPASQDTRALKVLDKWCWLCLTCVSAITLLALIVWVITFKSFYSLVDVVSSPLCWIINSQESHNLLRTFEKVGSPACSAFLLTPARKCVPCLENSGLHLGKCFVFILYTTQIFNYFMYKSVSNVFSYYITPSIYCSAIKIIIIIKNCLKCPYLLPPDPPLRFPATLN